MSYLVISTSLSPNSKSAILSKAAYEMLAEHEECEWVDLRDYELPHCDGDKAYGHPNVEILRKKIEQASCILMGVAIYNYDCGSSAKNLIELTGKAWEDKTVGFLCAAGGKSSYMAIMSLANSLMLDFRTLIIPRFVYADGSAFAPHHIVDTEIIRRISLLVDAAKKLCRP
ncbi:MAG: NAD(P)H-dependent oxidoreductase [Candidatus Obscuribacterales bacterium]|nr:NAD(P)H-dependent oxidoreductase [Candidatus Obscuribacterales bacterium]